ncbi:MAG: L-histidine N(alpha)-methyltransferase [Alphaproteobacteria bacterium]|nr:L-histidine N(alpha)-methyltransferase [Alphaproteobacteria bacterium]
MLKIFPHIASENLFEDDVINWFQRKLHGHMGKWQYIAPKFKGDPCRGNELWDIWEKQSSSSNMLNRQKQIIYENANAMARLSGSRQTMIDLGPGATHAVNSNTLPIIQAFKGQIKKYISIDMDNFFARESAKYVNRLIKNIECIGYGADFTKPISGLKTEGKVIGLLNGGTIGNFESPPNTKDAISSMAERISELKYNLPTKTILFISLESTQDAETLYSDYDHPAHAAYEINVMHAIKRDLIPHEEGFNPYAWKYAMKWWPEAYQFCHIAEATENQYFQIKEKNFRIFKGDQFVVDNSFKFPVLAMQRAVQLANASYLKPFFDNDSCMVIHAIMF